MKYYPHFGGEWALRIEVTDLFLVILYAYLIKDFITRRLSIQIPAVAIFWLLLIILGLGSIIFSPYRTMAAYEIISMTKMLLLFIYLVNYGKTRNQIKLVVAALMIGVFLQIIYGLMQHFCGLNLPLQRLGQSPEMVTEELGMRTASRVGAMLGHPNIFAGYLVMLLPLAFILIFVRISIWYKALCIAILVFGEMALILTLSRGGWISFATSVMVILFLRPAVGRQRIITLIFILGSALVIGLLFSGTIIQKFILSDPASISSRVECMYIAWRMIQSNFWWGTGLNSFTFVMSDYDYSGIQWGKMDPPVHNIYLLIFAEQGIFGILLFLSICFMVIRVGISNLKGKDNLLNAINLGSLAGFIAILVQGVGDWNLRINTTVRVFWTLAAMIFAIHFWNQKQESDKPEIQRRNNFKNISVVSSASVR
ncbi:MAG: O-antigen ligase family protein [bacterium]